MQAMLDIRREEVFSDFDALLVRCCVQFLDIVRIKDGRFLSLLVLQDVPVNARHDESPPRMSFQSSTEFTCSCHCGKGRG